MSKSENYTSLAVEFQNDKSHSTFPKLYHKMRPGLKNYIRNIVKDGDVTEDLLARTFEKIYRKIDTYKPEFSITTWAYSIARRECIRWIKRERNKKVSLSYFNENGGQVVESGGDTSISLGQTMMEPDALITEDEAWTGENYQMTQYDLTVKAINKLKPMYRDILVDVIFNEMKYKEVAFKIEPELDQMRERFENGELNAKQEKDYEKYYKTILQRVKNRVRRGKLIVADEVKAQMAKMDI